MATIAQILLQIRQAIFGKDVRESIAQGIEKCYTDVQAGVTTADSAAERAHTSADRSDEINEALADNAKDLILIQQNQPDKEFNRVWIKPESDEYIVPTYDEFSDLKNDFNSLTLGIESGTGLLFLYVNGVKQGSGIDIGGGSIDT